MRFRALLGAVLATAVLPAPAAGHMAHCEAPPAPDLVGDGLRFDPIGHQFAQPVHIASEPASARRLFVVERRGSVRVLSGGRLIERPFLDLSREVEPTVSAERNERGMQSIAFSPDYRRTGRVYVYYSDRRGDVRVDEFRRSRNPNRVRPGSRRNVLWVKHWFEEVHYGGQIAFGPDGLLYVALGDAELSGHAQLDRPYGKVVQLDPLSKRPARIVASGLRNPYRFSFAPGTGDMIIADVGGQHYEEINVIPADRRRVANFGWPIFEGPLRRHEGSVRGYVPPALAIPHPFGSAIIGGHVVRGDSLPEYTGRYLYGDFCDGWVASVLLGPEVRDNRDEGVTVPFISTFGTDVRGRQYAASTAGSVYRIRPGPAAARRAVRPRRSAAARAATSRAR